MCKTGLKKIFRKKVTHRPEKDHDPASGVVRMPGDCCRPHNFQGNLKLMRLKHHKIHRRTYMCKIKC